MRWGTYIYLENHSASLRKKHVIKRRRGELGWWRELPAQRPWDSAGRYNLWPLEQGSKHCPQHHVNWRTGCKLWLRSGKSASPGCSRVTCLPEGHWCDTGEQVQDTCSWLCSGKEGGESEPAVKTHRSGGGKGRGREREAPPWTFLFPLPTHLK